MKKEKRLLSQKQLENLARGRARRAENLKKSIEQKAAPVSLPAQNNHAAAEVNPELKNLPKVKKLGGRLWWQVGIGAVCLIIAALIAMAYSRNMSNVFLAAGFILFGAGGMLFLFMGLRKREEGMQLRGPGQGKKKSYPANCLNIYYGYDESEKKYYCDCIKFEELAPEQIISKHPQQCLDDGKWYYVHIYDPLKKKLEPFILQDTVYYSPAEFVNPLHMPASRKVLRPKPTLGEKLRPLIALGAMGLIILAFVLTAPSPQPETSPQKKAFINDEVKICRMV